MIIPLVIGLALFTIAIFLLWSHADNESVKKFSLVLGIISSLVTIIVALKPSLTNISQPVPTPETSSTAISIAIQHTATTVAVVPNSATTLVPTSTWTPTIPVSTWTPTLVPKIGVQNTATTIAAVPTATNLLDSCTITGVFTSVWQKYFSKLGCNLENPVTESVTYQQFEGGYLVWTKITDIVYVLPFNSAWSQHLNPWQPSDPTISCQEAEILQNPKMGFGKVWCSIDEVRLKLKNPIGPEKPNDFAQQQTFEGGLIFEILGGSKIIIFEDSSWREN